MSLRVRVLSVGALLVVFTYLTVANFIPKEVRLANPLLPSGGIILGLDLQGGIHWVVGVDLPEAEKQELEFFRNELERTFEDEQITVESIEVQGDRIVIEPRSQDDVEAIRDLVVDSAGLRAIDDDAIAGQAFVLTDDWIQETRERTMAQVLEVLRRRIDDPVRGIPDSVVTRQGSDRVLVQIPGGKIDRARARALLKSTGFLEFKIVAAQADNEELLRGRYPDGLPEGMVVALERDRQTSDVVAAYLVPEVPALTGQYLDDARVSFDQQQRSIVNFTFDVAGGELFGELTSEHIEEPLAIILDGNVYSAPIIRSRISRRGQITGRFSPQEAADLAVVLRAGALSVPVVIEEERSIGPALGQDSIDRGTRAAAIGLALIFFFMVGYYRLSGGFASFALAANLVLLMGLMSMVEATLTLPGIAGLVLTIGMAVDANVIIFERIREELRTGKTTKAAISAGFQKARWTVLDANITTFITAVILFEYGTGPIKGFAVTLSVGIVTSVFAALVVTRLLFQIYPGSRPVEQLSI